MPAGILGSSDGWGRDLRERSNGVQRACLGVCGGAAAQARFPHSINLAQSPGKAMITGLQLRAEFLSPAMKHYFDKKLAPLASEEVDVRIEEALKFLNMAIHQRGGFPVSEEIDEVWHYWILETMEYERLCSKLTGGKMIHHSANDYLEYADKELKVLYVSPEDGVAVLISYVRNYGPFEPDRTRYWPYATAIMEWKNWDTAALNQWLASALRPAG
jgi:hypothetical protein